MTKLLLKLFVKDYQDVHNHRVRKRYGMLSGIVGILCNALLFVVKLLAGLLTGAVAILADAFNNLSDAGSSVVTLVGFKMAGKPADGEHPFGHGRIEYIAGLVVSVAIIVMGIELIKTSVEKFFAPVVPMFHVLTPIILGVCILVKLWMALFNRKLGKMIASPVMKATAKDSISDSIATTVVLIGTIISIFYPNPYIDPALGVLVALFILFTGFNAAKECLSPLLGTPPDRRFIEEIEKTVLAHPEIIGIHDLIVHNYGPGRSIISLHAEVSAEMDFVKIHDVVDVVEFELKKKFDCDATIHMDPIALDDKFTDEIRALIGAVAAEISDQIHIHDLRVVRGDTHTNIIFDAAVPFDFTMSDGELARTMRARVREHNEKYFLVIHVEKPYC